MPRKKLPDPEKYCERCGKQLQRKRYGGVLEDMGKFRSRRYCSLHCANSHGHRGRSFKTQHKISAKLRGPHCESCGRTPENPRHLHVHHINGNWTDHHRENLRTLCAGCHLRLHTKPSPPCSVCGAKSRKGGMCQKHFQRWKKYGDPLLTKVRDGSPNGFGLVQVSSQD